MATILNSGYEFPESWVRYNSRVLGPAILAKNALEPLGRWEDLEGELTELYSEANEAGEGTFLARGEYLLTLARMPG